MTAFFRSLRSFLPSAAMAVGVGFAVPSSAQGQMSTTEADRAAADEDAKRALGNMSDMFTGLWGEAENSPLFVKPQPISIDFSGVAPAPWVLSGPHPEHWSAMPPITEGLAVPPGTNVQRAWNDWFLFDFDRAAKTKDFDLIRTSAHAWLAWNAAGLAPPDIMDNPQGEYFRALNGYRNTLAPDIAAELQKSIPNFESLKPGQQFGALLLAGRDKDRLSVATRAALEAVPVARRRELASIERVYFPLALEQKDPNWEDLAERADLMVSIADLDGDTRQAERWRKAASVLRRNVAVNSYGWAMKLRHQNFLMGGFDPVLAPSGNWEKKARELFTEDDPRLLRVTLAVTADFYGANRTDRAKVYADRVRFLCERQKCSDVRRIPEFAALEAGLRKAASSTNADAFAAAVTGATLDNKAASALANLETIPALKVQQDRCLEPINIKLGALPPASISAALKSPAIVRDMALCEFATGQTIVAAYRAAGVDPKQSEDYRTWLFNTGRAAVVVDSFAEAVPLLEAYIAAEPPGDSATGLMARAALIASAIQTQNWTKASERNAAFKSDLAGMQAANSIGALDYYNYMRGVDRNQVAIWLGDDAMAHLAFDLAASRAQDSRERRQDGAPGVFAEANFTRSLQFNAEFIDAANASWARYSRENAGSEMPVSRWDSLETGVQALQDALTDRTSLALAYAVAERGFPGVTPEVQQLIRRRRSLIEELAATGGAGGGINASDVMGKSSLELSQADRIAEAKRAEYRDIDLQLQQLAPKYFQLVRPRPMPLAEIQAVLAPDEAALLLLPTERGTHVAVVTRNAVRWHRSAMTAHQIDDAVRRLRWFAGAKIGPATDAEYDLWTSEVDGGLNGYDRDTAHMLYRELIAPIADTLASRRQLFVVAGGPLGSLPLSVLVTSPPQGRDDDPQALRSTSWMADGIAMSYLPSLQSLAFLRAADSEVGAERAELRFLGFGDPLLEGGTEKRGARGIRGGGSASLFADVQTNQLRPETLRARLTRLPGTREELTAISEGLKAEPNSLFLGAANTETQFKASGMGDVDVLVIATHALVAGELPGAWEPGLVFTPPGASSTIDDGYLTASEISRLRIGAGWVILSACNTGAGDGSEGAPGLSGLARSFFYSGAKTLLVSHWPVRDDAAPAITLNAILATKRKNGVNRASALQGSVRALRNDPSRDGMFDSNGINLTFAHPAAWAPYVLVGDGANR